jgi:carbamoyl-phosphate synthase/aspartate carbamoyltransferase
MLGKMRLETRGLTNGSANSQADDALAALPTDHFEKVEWVNPNTKNLVAEGEFPSVFKLEDACSLSM